MSVAPALRRFNGVEAAASQCGSYAVAIYHVVGLNGEMPRPSRDEALLRQFGERLRSLRADAGLSQEKLPELSGLHRTYIGHVERGAVAPTIQTIVRLAEGLRCDPGDLVAGLGGRRG